MDYNTFKTAYQSAYGMRSDELITKVYNVYAKMTQAKQQQWNILLQERESENTNEVNKMYITQVRLEEINKANEVASAQGFNFIGIESTDQITVYKLICRYGETDELYRLTVDTAEEKIVSDSVAAI